MEMWEIEARECIRDLVARYNANGDSGRIEQMMELFAKDAVMLIPPDAEYIGRDAIAAALGTVAKGTQNDAQQDEGAVRFIRHFTATHQIDVLDRDNARGRCYFAVLTEDGLDHWGRYRDRYRCIDGRWLFQERTVTLDGAIEGGWAGTDLASSRE